MNYLTIFDEKTIPALNECFAIVTRAFISGLSNKESAFRRLRSTIRNEKISDITVKEKTDHNSVATLAKLDKILDNYLGSEYLYDRINSLLDYHEYHFNLTGKMQNNNLSLNDMENALWKLALTDKIIYSVDHILSLSKRETLVSDKHNKEYCIFENTITTLISLIMSTESKDKYLEMLSVISESLDGNNVKLWKYRMEVLEYILSNLNEYEKQGKDIFNHVNILFAEELLKGINKDEEFNLGPISDWVDDVFLNHEGPEYIIDRTNFCLNMLAYLNYRKFKETI